MNPKALLAKLQLVPTLVTLLVVLLVTSWIFGQCRGARPPKQPKPIPGFVDQGAPTPGPAAQAPTVTEPLPIARPALTRAELEAAAKKYGYELRKPGPDPKPGTPLDELTAAPPRSSATFPALLAEETFSDFRSKAAVDVSAWLGAPGERLDLRAHWHDWTPPPVPICSSASFFQNEAKWVKEVGAGYIYSNGQAGLGGWGSFAYRGPKTGAITWTARALGAYSPESGAIGATGFALSW